MKNKSSAGKGDSPRNNFSSKYRENYDLINWKTSRIKSPTYSPSKVERKKTR